MLMFRFLRSHVPTSVRSQVPTGQVPTSAAAAGAGTLGASTAN